MPSLEVSHIAGKKRKRSAKEPSDNRKISAPNDHSNDIELDIQRLEAEISQSRKHYNNLVKLLEYAFKDRPSSSSSAAVVALCRTFCRLLVDGSFKHGDNMTKPELAVLKWLEDKYREYTISLLQLLERDSRTYEADPLRLVMRLVKQEVGSHGNSQWAGGIFAQAWRTMLSGGEQSADMRTGFVKSYFKFDDVRYHTLAVIPVILEDLSKNVKDNTPLINSTLEILFALPEPPSSDSELTTFLVPSDIPKDLAKTKKSHLRKGQDAWLAAIRLRLSKQQRKKILGVLVPQVVPWFTRPEQFMDFLTDSYDAGGETTLLALAGIFHLMQEKNLDYPSFFQKLYSLLDSGILHSKHRSRFFRLLDTFMASTHLPAAMVASFIKRLSRLSLTAPPSGIVVLVPWIYNMFKRHPATTFMMHRVARCPEEQEEWDVYGAEDPFKMEEEDPMMTGAIDSSVWELQTLQSHYHPNVATLAKIISEQFTKQTYNLEDFLDHSYNSLLDVELEREMKKSAVVEYVIPKSIFQGDEREKSLGSLLEVVLAS